MAIANLFEYLNRKYGDDQTLDKEVRFMTKTLFDPLVDAQAREQGREQGRLEDKLEVARALLQENSSIEFVTKITKLDEQTVLKIQEEIQKNK